MLKAFSETSRLVQLGELTPIHKMVRKHYETDAEYRPDATEQLIAKQIELEATHPGMKHGIDTHAFNTRWIAEHIAASLGFTTAERGKIARAAQMHDVGKRYISHGLLQCPRPLSKLERTVIQQHPKLGADYLASLSENLGLELSSDITVALHHHERWDGTGYPNGLYGNEIPIAARIASVADAYDALVTRRPYKQAWSCQLALDYLHEHKNKIFDPDCVDALGRQTKGLRRLRRGTPQSARYS